MQRKRPPATPGLTRRKRPRPADLRGASSIASAPAVCALAQELLVSLQWRGGKQASCWIVFFSALFLQVCFSAAWDTPLRLSGLADGSPASSGVWLLRLLLRHGELGASELPGASECFILVLAQAMYPN